MKTIHQNNLDVVDVLTQHQREQRRNSQQRYRRKKRQIVVSLAQDVQRLRLQILKHELERRILGSRPPTSVTPWIVVSEYYRLFRNGLNRPQTPAPSSVSKPTSYERDGTQINFLREVMSPDVSVNSGFGVDALIQEWSAVPLMYQDIAVHLVRLEYNGAHTILATVKACITITEEMLRWEFPYFVDRSQDHQTSRLMTKLVGQQLVIPTTARFEWDPIERRVLSVHYSSDLVTPFLKILGNIRDAAIVLDNSLLSLAMGS
ncbi:hypothetical protein PHMEG_00040185 [Phytophthora megakarya]|uniref:Bzip transcription factor n=1 Tax=Phytophthora megakarya TaxID=4795 RepID=A0A225UE15_9STRA|nr:hypothetical protein PHMEG_00040185 [Phytophthora megakarya]